MTSLCACDPRKNAKCRKDICFGRSWKQRDWKESCWLTQDMDCAVRAENGVPIVRMEKSDGNVHVIRPDYICNENWVTMPAEKEDEAFDDMELIAKTYWLNHPAEWREVRAEMEKHDDKDYEGLVQYCPACGGENIMSHCKTKIKPVSKRTTLVALEDVLDILDKCTEAHGLDAGKMKLVKMAVEKHAEPVIMTE